MKNKLYQTGMTLIEIMIALLIGAFLLGGVLQIFVSSKQTNRMQENLSRLQENGRFALDFLAKDIRMAGFIGCNSRATLTNTLNSPTDFLNDFSNAIEGFESTSALAWTPAINAAITSPLGGSDVIAIRRADDQSFSVTDHASNTAAITLDATATTANLKTAGFLKSDSTNNYATAVVSNSNCSTAAVFQVSGIAGTNLSHDIGANAPPCVPCNLTNNLVETYVGGQVYPINTVSYYVRTGPGGQPSLYHRIGSNDAEELVEGIGNMQILYGVDTEFTSPPRTPGYGVPNYYVSADNVAVANDWPKVVSIRITLTSQTIDGRIRRDFTSTIVLRNRLP